MRRVVFDSSVLVSVALSEHGVPAQAWKAGRALRFYPFTTQAIIDEVRTTLDSPRIRKRHDCARAAAALIDSLTFDVFHVAGIAFVEVFVRDPNDYMILAAAADAEADVLVTSDHDLLVLRSFRSTLILTPRQFLDWLDETEPDQGER
ncbi:MAG TPA: putative toxin-antitoxin system toxin component, PIN family [Longimicrobium sp.]|uniref:putative toxin-antitoxin system toxin component, PIN family n=1 Tax=Longimicrobium sp. TaxID=2029185 RepID=UPI002EDA555C